MLQAKERKVQHDHQIWLCNDCTNWITMISQYFEPYWVHRFCRNCETWINMFNDWTKEPENQKKKACIEQEKIERLLKKSWVGPMFKTKTLNDLKNKKSLFEICKKYCDNWIDYSQKWWWLYLWWKRWTGKTHTATAISNQLIEQHLVKVMFVNISEVASRVKKTFGKDKDEVDSTLFEEMMKVEMLVIDDIGLENTTPWLNEQFYIVMNYRYEHLKPVIITSNQSLEDLEKIHKPQVCSRLKQMCKIIQFNGDDLRETLRPDF